MGYFREGDQHPEYGRTVFFGEALFVFFVVLYEIIIAVGEFKDHQFLAYIKNRLCVNNSTSGFHHVGISKNCVENVVDDRIDLLLE